MYKKIFLRKTVVFGTILLFLGASVVSATNINLVSTNNINDINKSTRNTETFYPTDDSYIKQNKPDANHGGTQYFNTRNEYGATGGGWEWCGVIMFDVSSLPPGATIESAKLNIYYWEYWDINPAGRLIRLYRYLDDWDEYEITYGTQPSCASSPSSQCPVPYSPSYMIWDVTSDIQDFVDGEKTNYGWKVIDDNYWGYYDIPTARFRTKEYGSQTPFLEVELGITSDPPSKPTLDGPTTGKVGTSYVYTATATDPDGDKINYLFDWGDGTNSGWIGPYDSGAPGYGSHIWTDPGTYVLRVKASDINGAESSWSDPLLVTLEKKSKATNYLLFWRLLDQFPILQKLIQNLGL